MLVRPIRSCCYALTVYFTLSIAVDIDIALHKRQNVPVGTGVSVSPTSQAAATSTSNTSPISSDSPAPSSSLVDSQSTSQSDSSDDISSSSASSPSTTSFSFTPTSSSPTTSSVQIAASTASSATSSSATSESLPSSSRQPTSTQTPHVSNPVQQFTSTVVTVIGGSTFSNTITSSRVEAVTASSTPSTPPGLNSSNGGPGKSGLSSGQKRTIIGVVVGIGGAILLGGLAVVAWRIWGKRKTVKNDDYDPMDPLPGSADHEKTSGGGSSDPFRTHLDQHHNTAGPVNAASNF